MAKKTKTTASVLPVKLPTDKQIDAMARKVKSVVKKLKSKKAWTQAQMDELANQLLGAETVIDGVFFYMDQSDLYID